MKQGALFQLNWCSRQMLTPVTRILPCHCPSLYPESYQRDRILSEGQLWGKAQGKHEARWWGRMEDSNIIWNLYYSSKSNNHIFRLLLKGPLVKMGVGMENKIPWNSGYDGHIITDFTLDQTQNSNHTFTVRTSYDNVQRRKATCTYNHKKYAKPNERKQ